LIIPVATCGSPWQVNPWLVEQLLWKTGMRSFANETFDAGWVPEPEHAAAASARAIPTDAGNAAERISYELPFASGP
jgi:hypothetical protein